MQKYNAIQFSKNRVYINISIAFIYCIKFAIDMSSVKLSWFYESRNIPDHDQRLLIVPMKATFATHGNCNVPLTGPHFVFSRDISTSRYRCVCKSAGIISQMREADYKHPMNKKRGAEPDNGHSGCRCWQWRGHPRDIFSPCQSYNYPPYVHVCLLHSAILFMKITIIRDPEYSII